MNYSDYLLVERYRPKTVEECILPEETKKVVQDFVSIGKIPNLVFTGTAGTGKTTLSYALANQLGYDLLYVNGSNEGRSIDTLRGIVADFASSMSLEGNRKVVIIDEADGIPILVQDALRAFVEEYTATCSFILTANNKSKLTPAILSRFSEINFTIPPEEKNKVAVAMMTRIVYILDNENITYDKKAVAELVKRYFPDFRKTLNALQKYSAGGQFTTEQLKNLDVDISVLVKFIKDKDFTSTVEAIEKMASVDIASIANELYEKIDTYANPNDKPVVIKLLSDYLDKATRTPQPKITCLALLAELMASLD